MGGSYSREPASAAPLNDCESFSFTANLNSPQGLVQNLNVGDVLILTLQTMPHLAVLATLNGTVVGSLTGPNNPKLIRCMQNGYMYQATVLSVSGGNCSVKVSCQ